MGSEGVMSARATPALNSCAVAVAVMESVMMWQTRRKRRHGMFMAQVSTLEGKEVFHQRGLEPEARYCGGASAQRARSHGSLETAFLCNARKQAEAQLHAASH